MNDPLRKGYRVAALFIVLWLLPSAVLAQMEIPPIAGEMILRSGSTEFSMGVPEGWEQSVTESPTPYGIMTNISELQPGETPIQIQMILRPADQLEIQFDTEALNPALDYYEKYASFRGLKQEGAYADPVALRDGSQRAALMLYVEQNTNPRFEQYEHVLSLSFATLVEGDELAIILFEAPAENWIDLLAMGNMLLGTLKLNEQPLEFEENIAQLLVSFEPADSLVERFEAGTTLPAGALTFDPVEVGEPMGLRFIQNGITTSAPPDWVVLEDEDVLVVTAQTPDESATISMRVSLLPANYVSVLDLLNQQEEISKTVLFSWDTLLAAAGKIETEESSGALIVAELPFNGGLLWVRYEAADDTYDQVWLDFLTRIRVNDKTLVFDNVWGAMFQLEE